MASPKATPKEDTKLDLIVEAMLYEERWSTMDEIAAKVTKRIGRPVSMSEAAVALSYLRRNADAYGFTVSHVKRGPVKASGEKDRYIVMTVDKADTSFRFDEAARLHFDRGSGSTLKTIAQQSSNHAKSVELAIQYERSPKRREHLEEFLAEISYVARKARKMVRDFGNGTTG